MYVCINTFIRIRLVTQAFFPDNPKNFHLPFAQIVAMQAAILLKVREREKVTIGRNTAEIPPNKIQINSQYISSRHCQIIPENGKLILTDSSRNGTWVSSTNSGSVVSSEVKTPTPSIHIKSIYSIRNKTVPLEPNTYIIFIPPNLSKIPNEIVGLHFTGLDPAREFYHLECIKHNSMLENRQLMTFFSHMGFGKDYHNGFSSIVSTDMAMQTRKRMHPRSEEIGRVLSLGKSGEFGCKVDDGIVCKTLKFASEEEEVFKKSPKDCENSPPSKSAKVELEQCQFCLKDFPVLELIDHSEECKIETEKITISDKGETCFASLKHSSKFKLGKEKSIENCMKCFKEFPLSELIQHSENCKVSLVNKPPMLVRCKSSPT